MKFERLIRIVAESRRERDILSEAIDVMCSGPVELLIDDAVSEIQEQADAMKSATGTGVLTLHLSTACHLVLALDMLSDWALEEIENGVVPKDALDFPTLDSMLKSLSAEVRTF